MRTKAYKHSGRRIATGNYYDEKGMKIQFEREYFDEWYDSRDGQRYPLGRVTAYKKHACWKHRFKKKKQYLWAKPRTYRGWKL